ncbi:hypothetical protein OQA88_11868 [Cercophora sp. LCS_1]
MPQESTFRTFTPSQGANYAQHRLTYHQDVYDAILHHHTSTGGNLSTLVDIGCGPGLVTRDLAPHFTSAIGLDASEGMITTAQSLSTDPAISFHVSSAEDLTPVTNGSVDLITSANAAHWFDMSRFWRRAAEVLKPGGTVALWAGGSLKVDKGMVNAQRIQSVIDSLNERLDEYMAPGNRLVRGLYKDLKMPWDLEQRVDEFGQDGFVRTEWGTDQGSRPWDRFYVSKGEMGLDAFEMVLGTMSPVVRWREANPQLAGTEDDVVRIVRRDIEQCLRDGGVEEGKEVLKGGVSGVLLLVKRK